MTDRLKRRRSSAILFPLKGMKDRIRKFSCLLVHFLGGHRALPPRYGHCWTCFPRRQPISRWRVPARPAWGAAAEAWAYNGVCRQTLHCAGSRGDWRRRTRRCALAAHQSRPPVGACNVSWDRDEQEKLPLIWVIAVG